MTIIQSQLLVDNLIPSSHLDVQVIENKLVHGDFFEEIKKIPNHYFDLVIADPPYAINATSMGSRTLITDYMVMKPFFEQFFKDTERVSTSSSSMFMFCDWRTYPLIWLASASSSWKITNLIVWDFNWIKAGFGFRYTHELIAYFTKPDTLSPQDRSLSDVWRFKTLNFTDGSRLLETQKPLDIILHIIDNAPKPVNKVLDPFAGSGTVSIGCKIRKINCLAYEINPINYQIANDRITQESKQAILSSEEEAKVEGGR